MTEHNADRQAVINTLETMWKAYGDKDAEIVAAMHLNEPTVTAIGAGSTEILTSHQAIKEAFADDMDCFDSVSISLLDHQVTIEGSVAWVAGRCETNYVVEGQELGTPAHLTAVLVKRDGEWKIAHTHFSFPPEEDMPYEEIEIDPAAPSEN